MGAARRALRAARKGKREGVERKVEERAGEYERGNGRWRMKRVLAERVSTRGASGTSKRFSPFTPRKAKAETVGSSLSISIPLIPALARPKPPRVLLVRNESVWQVRFLNLARAKCMLLRTTLVPPPEASKASLPHIYMSLWCSSIQSLAGAVGPCRNVRVAEARACGCARNSLAWRAERPSLPRRPPPHHPPRPSNQRSIAPACPPPPLLSSTATSPRSRPKRPSTRSQPMRPRLAPRRRRPSFSRRTRTSGSSSAQRPSTRRRSSSPSKCEHGARLRDGRPREV